MCIHEGCGTSLPFIKLDVLSLVFGMFGAGAVMISFGAVLGKVSANQMFLLALLEVVFYSVNVYVGYLVLEVIDVGGSAFIHLFGAYFGLGATYFLTPEKSKRNFRDNESAYHSDLFSFIGTVFLWIYWPSFNAVLVDQQYQVCPRPPAGGRVLAWLFVCLFVLMMVARCLVRKGWVYPVRATVVTTHVGVDPFSNLLTPPCARLRPEPRPCQHRALADVGLHHGLLCLADPPPRLL